MTSKVMETKVTAVLFGTLLQTLLATLYGADTLKPPTKPNIVFILADDPGWRDTGCYGSAFHETPNFDRLATRGIRLTQAAEALEKCTQPSRSFPKATVGSVLDARSRPRFRSRQTVFSEVPRISLASLTLKAIR